MTTSNFQRKAVATAVSAVLTAGLSGAVSAATLTPFNITVRPTLDGAPFVPAINSHMTFAGAYNAAQTQDVTVEVIYLDNTNTEVNSTPEVDTAGADDSQLDANAAPAPMQMTLGDPATATKAVVVLSVPAGDDFGAGNQAAWVDPVTGSVSGAADRATALATAITASAFVTLDSAYTGIGLSAAFRDTATTPSEVFLEFLADPTKADGTPWSAGDQFSFAVPNALSGGAIEDTGAAVDAEVTGVSGNVIGLADLGGGAFLSNPGTAKTNGAVSQNLGDGAGNAVRVTLLPIETLTPPSYSTTNPDSVAVATTIDPDAAYGDAGVLPSR